MRILLFDCKLDGHHAEYASYLITHFLEGGDSVTFATCGDAQALGRFQGLSPSVQIRMLRQRPAKSPSSRGRSLVHAYGDLRRCFQLADLQGVDIFHHLYFDGAEIAWLAAPRRKDRKWRAFATMFWLHYTRSSGARASLGNSLIPFAKRKALRAAMRTQRLDGLFVHSRRASDALTELLGAKTAVGRVAVIPDPAPCPTLVPQNAARERLRLPKDQPVMLFFGGLRRNKGPDVFVRALRSLPGAWTAVLAGQPLSVSEQEIRELVAALPDPSKVVLRLGVIPDREVDDYFAAADAVVLPYTRSFGGTSGVLMRAMAAARPVVATDVGDVGPTVRTHKLGVVVPAESPEALAAGLGLFLANREKMAHDVSIRALEYARENGWNVMAAAVRNTYAHVDAAEGLGN